MKQKENPRNAGRIESKSERKAHKQLRAKRRATHTVMVGRAA